MSAYSILLTTILTISAHAGPLCATLSWHHWNQDNGGGKYYITPDCRQNECYEERDLEHSHWDNNASGFKVEKYCQLDLWCGGTRPLKGYDSFKYHMMNKNNDYVYDFSWHGPEKKNLGGSWNDCISAFRCHCKFPSVDAMPADYHGNRRRAEDAEEATDVAGSVAPDHEEAAEGVVVVHDSQGSVSLTGSVSMEALRAAIERVEHEEAPGFTYAWDQTEAEGLRTFDNSVTHEEAAGFTYAWDQTEDEGLRTFENPVTTPPEENAVLARLLDGEANVEEREANGVETEEVTPSPQKDASDQKQPQGELSEDASASATAATKELVD